MREGLIIFSRSAGSIADLPQVVWDGGGVDNILQV